MFVGLEEQVLDLESCREQPESTKNKARSTKQIQNQKSKYSKDGAGAAAAPPGMRGCIAQTPS
jgi:hypothetical protein